ncbi:MAG: glycosyltransferase family 2 protein [Succinivibrio sp.]|nr:glycosyltransferase family 2 protein [Succinivibrio sp.]
MNPTADYDLTVIIPIYNDEKDLPQLFDVLESYTMHATVKVCYLLVNDASSDNSLVLMRECCLRRNGFFYLSLERRTGFTGALKAGIMYVASPLMGFMDANLATSPFDFELLLPRRNDVALVCGIRDHSHDSFFTHLHVKLFSKFRRMVTHDDIVDTTCPLKLGKTKVLQALPWYSGMYCFMPALVKLTGQGVATVMVHYERRSKFKSKTRFLMLSSFSDLFVFMWMKHRYVEPAISETNLARR